VLDLDLSEFPLKQTASETTVAVVEAPETVELTNVMGEDLPPFFISSLVVLVNSLLVTRLEVR
jgi:hypothetical protein